MTTETEWLTTLRGILGQMPTTLSGLFANSVGTNGAMDAGPNVTGAPTDGNELKAIMQNKGVLQNYKRQQPWVVG